MTCQPIHCPFQFLCYVPKTIHPPQRSKDGLITRWRNRTVFVTDRYLAKASLSNSETQMRMSKAVHVRVKTEVENFKNVP